TARYGSSRTLRPHLSSSLIPYTTLFRSALCVFLGQVRRGMRALAHPPVSVARGGRATTGRPPLRNGPPESGLASRSRRALPPWRSEEHTSELQSPEHLVSRAVRATKQNS